MDQDQVWKLASQEEDQCVDRHKQKDAWVIVLLKETSLQDQTPEHVGYCIVHILSYTSTSINIIGIQGNGFWSSSYHHVLSV
jgi:hypothetical protein